MKDIKIRLTQNKSELNQVLKLREAVFIKGQNVHKDLEVDGLDNVAKHVMIFYKNKLVGCARIRFIGKKAKAERMAILKSYRSKGLGSILMNYIAGYCKRRNVKEIMVNAQYYVKNFYIKAGFKPRGKTFTEAGIKHVEMYLNMNQTK